MVRAQYLSVSSLILFGCIADEQPASDTRHDMHVSSMDAASSLDASLQSDVGQDVGRDVSVEADVTVNDAVRPAGRALCDMPLTGLGPWEVDFFGAATRHEGSCGGGGPEVVILFRAPEAGEWVFSTSNQRTSGTDTVIYIRDICQEPGSERACNDDGGADFTSSLRIALNEGEAVYVFVDIWAHGGGQIRLTADIGQPANPGESCNPARICPSGFVCFGDDDSGVCTEYRERSEGEACDPRGETGPCAEGLDCLRTTGRRVGVCTEPRVVGEGEVCDLEGGILQCESGLACAHLGMQGSFCLPIQYQEEGVICDPTDVTRPCTAGSLCVSEGAGAPRCSIADSVCPREWTTIALEQAPGMTLMGSTEMAGISTLICSREEPAPVAVFSFTAPESSDWVFETGPVDDGAEFDTLLELRTHCSFGATHALVCNDDGGPRQYSRARWSGLAGQTIYVLVGGFAGTSGAFTVSASSSQ
jgi:hypothetical protein